MRTLSELRDQARVWSSMEEMPDSQINHFIILAEQEFKDDLYLPPNERVVVLTTDVDGRIPIPMNYLKAKHMSVVSMDGRVKPLYRKPNELVTGLGSIASTNAISYFERSGMYFIFAPAAGEGVEVTLTYYRVIDSLIDIDANDPGTVNFVMSVMPTIYLFGTLMFLHMFKGNEEKANYYAGMFKRAKSDLVGMQADAEMSGSSLHVVPTMSDNGSIW